MEVDAEGGRVEGREPLREEPRDHAPEDVARAAGREGGPAGRIHADAPAGLGHDRGRALQHRNRPRLLREAAGGADPVAVQRVGGRPEQERRLAGVRA